MGRELDNSEIETCARAAHEVIRAYCIRMGNFSHASWDATPPELKALAKQSVIGIITHDFNNEQSHAAWVVAKKASGWTYGPVKNPETKEHPCLVAWAQLPFEEQVKDDLWISTVKAMMGALWRIPN